MFGPSRFFPVLWPLLTSHSSLLLRIFFRIRLLHAPVRPPRVLTHSFPLYLPYLPQMIPCSYWTLTYAGVLSSSGALYMVSVRQARVSPPSFFRFHLTMDTLDLGYILPTAGRIRDLHPLERALTGRTTIAAGASIAPAVDGYSSYSYSVAAFASLEVSALWPSSMLF